MNRIEFIPFPLLSTETRQTIVGCCLRNPFDCPSKQELIQLSDGDQISLEITTPSSWKEGQLSVLMIHGLCGSHKSPYLVRMAKRLNDLGIRSIRFNMRGCGSGKPFAKKIYHAGQSFDLFEVLKAINCSPLLLLGFSMGGNLVLKLASELGNASLKLFNQIIAVSPPIDLYSCLCSISQKEHRLYEKYFVRLLKRDANEKWEIYPDFPKVNIDVDTFYEFDSIYTAPFGGFKNAIDYYVRSSSKPLLSNLKVPTKILISKDDPIIDFDVFKDLPNKIEINYTDHGGHLGFLAKPKMGHGFRFMDELLIKWILEYYNEYGTFIA